jgi:hypothetical protein
LNEKAREDAIATALHDRDDLVLNYRCARRARYHRQCPAFEFARADHLGFVEHGDVGVVRRKDELRPVASIFKPEFVGQAAGIP